MKRFPVVLISCTVIACVAALALPGVISAQDRKSCLHLTSLHRDFDCIEALFSQTPYHFTFAGLPPGNGMAFGGELESTAHDVSPFGFHRDPVLRPKEKEATQGDTINALLENGNTTGAKPIGGYKSVDHGYLVGTGTTNGSWAATGGFDWFPPLHYEYSDRPPTAPGAAPACHQFSSVPWICTKSVLAMHLEAAHRSIQTISFYGLGAGSPAVKYTYQFNETYGGVSARMPLFDWLTVSGGIEDRQPELPARTGASALNVNFTEATAPGVSSQPNFLQSQVGISSVAYIRQRNPSGDPDYKKTTPPLIKRHSLYGFSNEVSYHWYSDQDSGHYSFGQFEFDGDESLQLGGVIEEFIPGSERKEFRGFKRFRYDLLAASCGIVDRTGGAFKVTDVCTFGRVDINSHLVLSRVSQNQVVPFYLQPTVGGADFDSRVSLRGYPDYRFRGADAAFVQFNYSLPVWGPIEALTFYDAGTAGQSASQLSLAHYRQDAGVGANIRFAGAVVAQSWLALGAGHGIQFGYSFSKLF